MEEACLSGSSMASLSRTNRLGEHENAQIEWHDTHEQELYTHKGGSAGPSAGV